MSGGCPGCGAGKYRIAEMHRDGCYVARRAREAARAEAVCLDCGREVTLEAIEDGGKDAMV